MEGELDLVILIPVVLEKSKCDKTGQKETNSICILDLTITFIDRTF